MKQDFELSEIETKAFLKYFNAALRDPEHGMMIGSGEASFQNDKYVIRQTANFKFKGNPLYAIWRIILTQDGRLLSIQNENTVDDEGQYDLTLAQFINDVLQRVYSKKTSKFFRRTYYRAISGCNLPGEYWLPGFRFAPLYPDDDSRLINAERIIVIDQVVEAIDRSHADELALEESAQYSSYLSFILDVGIEPPKHEEKYFLIKDGTTYRMERFSCQLIDTSIPAEMPQKGQICRLGKFEGSVFDKHRYLNQYLVCPIETRKILKRIQSLPEIEKEAFSKCCLLYQFAGTVGKYHPTVRAAYECAAVDAFVRKTKGAYGDFKAFLNHYAGADEDLNNLMYGEIRSAHFHSGEFPLGELEFSRDFISGPQSMVTFNILLAAHLRIRKAILEWLDNRIRIRAKNLDT